MDFKIKKILENHEKRILALEERKTLKSVTRTKNWYKSGSTIEKIVLLIKEGFFNSPCSISEIVSKLKTKDYHLKSSDLTFPLRKIVRKELLGKIKTKADGSPSASWLYRKV